MDKNEVSILLEILDLEYLKPILIDRFQKIDQLFSVNLNDIGVQNPNDVSKLRYILHELEQKNDSIDQYDPIVTIHDSNQIITRMENEINLISSSLNLLLNNNNINLPKDDATSDIDYSLYNSQIDQIEDNVQQLQNNTEQLMEQIPIQSSNEKYRENSIPCNKETFVMITLSVLCIGFIFYIKRK